MSETTINELLDNIYLEIERRNKREKDRAIPRIDEFYPFIAKRYGIIESKIPELIDVLRNSHKIFCFEIVIEDNEKKIKGEVGIVVAEINRITPLVKHYEKELIRIFFEDKKKYLSAEKVVTEITNDLSTYNNTELGKLASITKMLNRYEDTLNMDYSYLKDARQYSVEWRSKRYRKELDALDPVSSFLKKQEGREADKGKSELNNNSKEQGSKRRQVDYLKKPEKVLNSLEDEIQKNINIYGVEFYTKICFREYKFPLMLKVIDGNYIKKKEDLLVLKKYIKNLRSNSDRDLKLQKYAKDINILEKKVNERLK